MKKLIFASLLSVCALITCADQKKDDFFPPIIPQNILQLYLRMSYKYTDAVCTNTKYYVDRQDAATLAAANAYTDSKSVTGDITALSNRVNKAESDIVKNENDIVVVSNNTVVAKGVADEALFKANNPPVLSINGKTGVVSVVEGPTVYVRTVNGATGDVTSVAFKPFDASWTNNHCTIDEFLHSVWVTGKKPTIGDCYLGQFRYMTPAPVASLTNDWYEVIMEVPAEDMCVLRATSTSTQPYFWRGFCRTDYTFDGWNTEALAQVPVDGAGDHEYFSRLKVHLDNNGNVTASKVSWEEAPVTSVNGKTGAVTLTEGPTTYVKTFNGNSGDVTYTAPVTSVNGETGAVTTKAFLPFDSSWKNSGTTVDAFCESVYATGPAAGSCFLGGFYQMTPGPCQILTTGNYEVIVEVPVYGVYTLKATSTNISPYHWEGTWNGSFSGWKQVMNAPCPTTSGQYLATLDCTVNSSGLATSANIQWTKIENKPTTDGTYTLKLTKSGSTYTYKWVQD